jgi:CheY-like chemotaxis protein
MCFKYSASAGGRTRSRFLAMSKGLRPFVSCPPNKDKEDSARPTAFRGVQSFVRRCQAHRPLVLIIDDGCEARDLYTAYFEFHGFATQAAEDGLAGIEAAVSLVPDAIVLDFSMPGMDGSEVLRRLKCDPRTSNIPVVMLTAMPDRVPSRTRAWCAAFLSKPCEPDLLMHAIAPHMGEREA